MLVVAGCLGCCACATLYRLLTRGAARGMAGGGGEGSHHFVHAVAFLRVRSFHLSCPSNTYSTIHGFFCIGLGLQNFVSFGCVVYAYRENMVVYQTRGLSAIGVWWWWGGVTCVTKLHNRLIFIIIEEHESVRGECGKRRNRVEGCGYVAGCRLLFSFLSSSEGRLLRARTSPPPHPCCCVSLPRTDGSCGN